MGSDQQKKELNKFLKDSEKIEKNESEIEKKNKRA